MTDSDHSHDAKGNKRREDLWTLAFVLTGSTLSYQVTHDVVESALVIGLLSIAGALMGWLLSRTVAHQRTAVKGMALFGFSIVVVALATVFIW